MLVQSPSQLQILYRNRTNNTKHAYRCVRPPSAKAILDKKSNAKDLSIPHFRMHYRAVVIKTARLPHRSMNTRENPETNSHGHMIFHKDAKNVFQNKDSLFNKQC